MQKANFMLYFIREINMKTLRIGKENATFQEIMALKENRTKRQQKRIFFVEGVQNIKEAIANDWSIFALIYCENESLSEWAKGILSLAKFNYILSRELMAKLSDKSDTSEILALIEMKDTSTLKAYSNPLMVLLDRPSKKGNLGTIIRSCDALNVDHIFIIGHSVDLYDHQVITSTMGSFFKMEISVIKSFEEYNDLVKTFRKKYKNFQVVGTSLQTNEILQKCDFTKPTMLLVGNENSGLSKSLKESADTLVQIKMRNGIDSLNVACATSICLYEISRQRTL